MQAINREAPTPLLLFMLLFGTGAACLVLVIYAALHLQDPRTPAHRRRALPRRCRVG